MSISSEINPWADTIRVRFDRRDWPEEPAYVVLDPDGRLLFEHYDLRLTREVAYALSQQRFDAAGQPYRLHVFVHPPAETDVLPGT